MTKRRGPPKPRVISMCQCGHPVVDHHFSNYRRDPWAPPGERGHGKCRYPNCHCVACHTVVIP